MSPEDLLLTHAEPGEPAAATPSIPVEAPSDPPPTVPDLPEGDAADSSALADESPAPTAGPPEPIPDAPLPAEILPPAQVTLRTGLRKMLGPSSRAMAALTNEALWIQDTWNLRRVELSDISNVGLWGDSDTIVLTVGVYDPVETIELTFSAPGQGERWAAEIRGRVKLISPETAAGEIPAAAGVRVAAGVPLLRVKTKKVPHTQLGRIQFAAQSGRLAAWGLCLRAGMMGADAVIDVVSRKCPDLGFGARSLGGLAVRIGDDDALKQLRMRGYRREVSSLSNRCTALIIAEMVVLFVAGLFGSSRGGLDLPTSETPTEQMAATVVGMIVVFAWPVIMLGTLRMLRWPQLLRATGVAVLAATTLRGLTLAAAHLLAVANTSAPLEKSRLWLLIDPFDWAFVVIGGVLCVRAWRLANECQQLLPPELQVASPLRRFFSRGLLGTTLVYALFVVSVAGFYRYFASAGILEPGVDIRREKEALLALNQGVEFTKKGDLASAEESFRQALKLWDELTAQAQVPPRYRKNLAIVLADLGWLHQRQGQSLQAMRSYSRCVAIADKLAAERLMDGEFEQKMSGAREFMAEARAMNEYRREADELKATDDKAWLKYEEAHVKVTKGDAAAEKLLLECIETWERNLAKTINEEYKRAAVVQLAATYLKLGRFQLLLGKRTEAEASLRWAIEYGEKALAQGTDRPGVRHNLELSRRDLLNIREHAHQEAIDKLCEAMRFSDAAEQYRRGLSEAEELLRTGKDRDLATRLLSYRLERFAWFLGHNPEVLDTKAAVGYARRATDLMPTEANYWFTLGLVQYRNKDWRDSLASLEKLRTIEGEYDGPGLLLIAMNRQRLGLREEALAGLGKAIEWIEKRRQEAEKDAQAMFNYEQSKPLLESLRKEAEILIKENKRDID